MFNGLVGQLITKIDGATVGSDKIVFTTATGGTFTMYHSQDCCESVEVNEIIGDLADLLDTPILAAEESTNSDEPPTDGYVESHTWTFYRIITIHGTVVLRWLGQSNGYYSEGVTVYRTE